MTTIPDLSTDEARKAWMLTHAAESHTFWETQVKLNGDFEARLRSLETRVLALATIGSVLGSLVGRFFF